MIKPDKLIGILALVIFFYYVIIKERVEEGCENNLKLYFNKQTCNNQNSSFLIGTKPEEGDDYKTTMTKLRNAFRSFDKDVYWRKGMIMSLLISLLVFLVYKYYKEFNLWSFYIIMVLSFTVVYFFQNYMYYHFYGLLRDNGLALLDKLDSFQK